MTEFELEGILRWIMSTGAGVIVSYLVERWQIFAALQSEAKRLAVYASTALVAWAAWGVLVAAGLEPCPYGWWQWASALVAVAAVAIVAGGVTHGRMVLSRRATPIE